MITIRVCKNADGSYGGLTVSDRWNLSVLMTDYRLSPNLLGFKGFRGRIAPIGFRIVSCKAGVEPVTVGSDAEVDAFTPVNVLATRNATFAA